MKRCIMTEYTKQKTGYYYYYYFIIINPRFVNLILFTLHLAHLILHTSSDPAFALTTYQT